MEVYDNGRARRIGSVELSVYQFWSGIWNLCGRVFGFSDNKLVL